MTKHLLRNSCDLQGVLCTKKSVICSSRYAYTNLIVLRANFGCKTLQRLVVEQPIQSDYFVHLWCIRKDICILLAQQDGHKITHSCMIFVFMAQFLPSNPTQFVFSCTLSPSLPWLSFLFEEKKKRWKLQLIEYFNDCLFTETHTVPAQAD